MIEIRIHGRGGQGAVVASKIMAVAFFNEGYEVQSFPAFGVERRGAPVCAFTRVDREPIRLRSEIYRPDHVIVLDINLIETVDVTQGLKQGGTVLVNAESLRLPGHKLPASRIAMVDASAIAVRHNLGTATAPIINTAIIGAFARFTGLLTLDSLEHAIRQESPVRPDDNIAATREAYGSVVILPDAGGAS